VKKKGRDRSGSRLATQQSSRILMLRGCTFLQRPLQSNSFMDDDACRVPQQPHWQEIMRERLHGHRGDGLSKLNEIIKPSGCRSLGGARKARRDKPGRKGTLQHTADN
jgi:hypothetical protein